jgi:hypothetical protein
LGPAPTAHRHPVAGRRLLHEKNGVTVSRNVSGRASPVREQSSRAPYRRGKRGRPFEVSVAAHYGWAYSVRPAIVRIAGNDTSEDPMKKFLVLYKAPTSAFEQMQKATPEQQKAGMEAWMTWSKKAAASIVDMGAPLGKSVRVTQAGQSPTSNDLGGFSILQGESKEALADALKGHPHFMMPGGFIEVVELMPIPGM